MVLGHLLWIQVAVIIYYGQFLCMVMKQVYCSLVLKQEILVNKRFHICIGFVIRLITYARTEETAKNKTVYERMTLGELLICFFFGLAPAFVLLFGLHITPAGFGWQLVIPLIVTVLLSLLMKRKILDVYMGKKVVL